MKDEDKRIQDAWENLMDIQAEVAAESFAKNLIDTIEQSGDGAGQQRFARARTAHHDDVAFLYLNTIIIVFLTQAFVVVIHRYTQSPLYVVLSNNILVKHLLQQDADELLVCA